eukprot:1019690-Ditylum_brightwellii.AAC.1
MVIDTILEQGNMCGTKQTCQETITDKMSAASGDTYNSAASDFQSITEPNTQLIQQHNTSLCQQITDKQMVKSAESARHTAYAIAIPVIAVVSGDVTLPSSITGNVAK